VEGSFFFNSFAFCFCQMQSFCAVKPVTQQASYSVWAAARRTRIIACITALLLLGVLVLAVAVPGNRTSLLNRAVPQPDDAYDGQQVMINGDTVLGNAGLIGLQNLRKDPVAKLEEGSPLLNDSPQASSIYDDGDIGPAGSQQGEKPGHWGRVGSENYGTPLWDNTVCGYVNCLCLRMCVLCVLCVFIISFCCLPPLSHASPIYIGVECALSPAGWCIHGLRVHGTMVLAQRPARQ
jgi:hypothetical protein